MKSLKFPIVLITALAVTGCASGPMGGSPYGGLGEKEALGTAVGAALGGLLGSQFGQGGGQLAATAAGTAIGGVLGNATGRSLDRADTVYSAPVRTAPHTRTRNWTEPR